jgi:hypothetical protein
MGYDDNLHELIDLLPTDKRQQVYHLVQEWVKPNAEPVAKHWHNSSLAQRMRMPIVVTEDFTPLTRDEIYDRNSDR